MHVSKRLAILAAAATSVATAGGATASTTPTQIHVAESAHFLAAPPPIPDITNTRAKGVTPFLPDAAADVPAADGELTSLRTATSRTFQRRDGLRETRLYSAPVNVKDSGGAWVPADTGLASKADGSWVTKRAAVAVSLPSTLAAAPVAVTASAGQTVTFALDGASAAAGHAQGSSAVYDGVRPGVDARYDVLPDGVKETLVLHGALAPASYDFRYTLPAGAALQHGPAGSLEIIRAGATLLTLPAPSAVDSATGAAGPARGTAAFTITGSSLAPTVHVTLDKAWLTDPARVFPVLLDPTTVTSTGVNDTYIEGGGQATTNYSSASTICAGYDSAHTAAAHGLVQFVINGLPTNVKIVAAGLHEHVTSVTGSTTLGVYPVTTAWTDSQATWTVHNTGANWTTAGGDLGTLEDSQTLTAADPTGSYHTWTVNPADIQSWLEAPAANKGFALRAATETSGNLACLQAAPGSSNQPYLGVLYEPVLGTPGYATTFDHTVDNHESLHVNVSDGNLVDESTEFTAPGAGVPLAISRAYNSLTSSYANYMVGQGWYLTPGDSSADYLTDNDTYTTSNSIAVTGGPDGSVIDAHPANYANLTAGTYTDPLGDNVSVDRDGSNNLLVHDHATFTVRKFLASNDNMMDSITDRHGNAEGIAYGTDVCTCYGDKFVSVVTDTAGRTYTYAHNAAKSKVIGITGPTPTGGAALTTAYAQTGNDLTDARDNAGNHTYYTYDTSHRMTSITTPAGRKILISYYAGNQVQSLEYVTNPTSCTVTSPSTCTGDTYNFAYTAPTSFGGTGTTVVTDPNGHNTTYTWGALGRVTVVTDALSRARSTAYNINGNKTTLTDNLSAVYTTTYDNLYNAMSVQAPTLASGTAGRTSTLGYPMPTLGMDGHSSMASYEPTTAKDAQSNTTGYMYNATGDVMTVTPPAGSGSAATNYHYQGDPSITCGAKPGELCSSVNGDGVTTSYSYDTAGNNTYITKPGPLGNTAYYYDPDGRLLNSTDGKGQITYFTYNPAGQLQTSQTGSTCTMADQTSGACILYGYDLDGNLTSRGGPTGSTSITYDQTGAPATKSIPGSTTSSITADPAGNILTYTDAGGTVTYGYDNANDVTSLAEPGGSCTGTISRCTTFGYDLDGNRSLTTYPSGEKVKVTRDTGGRITETQALRPSGTSFYDLQVDHTNYGTSPYSDTSLVTARTVTTPTQSNEFSYSYDALNRLTFGTGDDNYFYTYSYDADGNRTYAEAYIPSPFSLKYSRYSGYDNADQACYSGSTSGSTGGATCPATPSGDTAFTYDLDGSQLTNLAGSTSATYNNRNQTASTTTGGVTTSYSYADTDQTERTSATATAATTVRNGILGVAGQTVGSSSPVFFTRDPQGNLISLRVGAGGTSTNSYYTLDQQGTVERLTDSTGNTDTATYTYDPYGQILSAAGTQAAVNPYRYATGYYDANTGLEKLGTRYYDSSLGRFTQIDPSGREANAYAYAEDSPTNDNDPLGLEGSAFDEYGMACGYGATTVVVAGAATGVTETVVGGVLEAGAGCATGVIGTFVDHATDSLKGTAEDTLSDIGDDLSDL